MVSEHEMHDILNVRSGLSIHPVSRTRVPERCVLGTHCTVRQIDPHAVEIVQRVEVLRLKLFREVPILDLSQKGPPGQHQSRARYTKPLGPIVLIRVVQNPCVLSIQHNAQRVSLYERVPHVESEHPEPIWIRLLRVEGGLPRHRPVQGNESLQSGDSTVRQTTSRIHVQQPVVVVIDILVVRRAIPV